LALSLSLYETATKQRLPTAQFPTEREIPRRLPSLVWRSRRLKKLQNVMAITDFLALFWQSQHN